jgi:truncated hemoglobin YjbI
MTECLKAIKDLVARFAEHIDTDSSVGCGPLWPPFVTQLRREFLDPFWKALGWDMYNEQGVHKRRY